MSKISDYIRAVKDHFNRIEEDRQRQTVAEFADELRKPVDTGAPSAAGGTYQGAKTLAAVHRAEKRDR